MSSSKFEIRYTQSWVNAISGKRIIRCCEFYSDSFKAFAGFYRYLQYGDIPVRVRIQFIRMGEITLPFSKKSQRIKGVRKRLFDSWEVHLFNLL